MKERAETYRVMSYYYEAITDFTKALKVNPGDVWARARRGLAYRAVRLYQDAVADLSWAAEHDPDNPLVAVAGRGETYRLMGKYDESITDLCRAIEIKPDYLWAIERRSQTYRAAERYRMPSPI